METNTEITKQQPDGYKVFNLDVYDPNEYRVRQILDEWARSKNLGTPNDHILYLSDQVDREVKKRPDISATERVLANKEEYSQNPVGIFYIPFSQPSFELLNDLIGTEHAMQTMANVKAVIQKALAEAEVPIKLIQTDGPDFVGIAKLAPEDTIRKIRDRFVETAHRCREECRRLIQGKLTSITSVYKYHIDRSLNPRLEEIYAELDELFTPVAGFIKKVESKHEARNSRQAAINNLENDNVLDLYESKSIQRRKKIEALRLAIKEYDKDLADLAIKEKALQDYYKKDARVRALEKEADKLMYDFSNLSEKIDNITSFLAIRHAKDFGFDLAFGVSTFKFEANQEDEEIYSATRDAIAKAQTFSRTANKRLEANPEEDNFEYVLREPVSVYNLEDHLRDVLPTYIQMAITYRNDIISASRESDERLKDVGNLWAEILAVHGEDYINEDHLVSISPVLARRLTDLKKLKKSDRQRHLRAFLGDMADDRMDQAEHALNHISGMHTDLAVSDTDPNIAIELIQAKRELMQLRRADIVNINQINESVSSRIDNVYNPEKSESTALSYEDFVTQAIEQGRSVITIGYCYDRYLDQKLEAQDRVLGLTRTAGNLIASHLLELQSPSDLRTYFNERNTGIIWNVLEDYRRNPGQEASSNLYYAIHLCLTSSAKFKEEMIKRISGVPAIQLQSKILTTKATQQTEANYQERIKAVTSKLCSDLGQRNFYHDAGSYFYVLQPVKPEISNHELLDVIEGPLGQVNSGVDKIARKQGLRLAHIWIDDLASIARTQKGRNAIAEGFAQMTEEVDMSFSRFQAWLNTRQNAVTAKQKEIHASLEPSMHEPSNVLINFTDLLEKAGHNPAKLRRDAAE